jgi:hypothetical protein
MKLNATLAVCSVALLAACGGGGGSVSNTPPSTSPPSSSQQPKIIVPITSQNSLPGMNGTLGGTSFAVLADESQSETTRSVYLIVTTDLLDGYINGSQAPDTVTEDRFGREGVLTQPNVRTTANSRETYTVYGAMPYVYDQTLPSGGSVSMLVQGNSATDGYRHGTRATVEGTNLSGSLIGTHTYAGRSQIIRMDNEHPNRFSLPAEQIWTRSDEGTFQLDVDFGARTAVFSSTSANSNVSSNSIQVDVQNGTFSSNNVTIDYITNNRTGQIYGNFNGVDGEGVTGIFTTTDNAPAIVGAIAGSR